MQILRSASGRKVGYLTHEHNQVPVFGGIGTLYRKGCDVAIIFDPAFGTTAVRKFTIAGNGIAVSGILPVIIELEEGWGGREAIIGSPRYGSNLPEQSVLEIALACL